MSTECSWLLGDAPSTKQCHHPRRWDGNTAPRAQVLRTDSTQAWFWVSGDLHIPLLIKASGAKDRSNINLHPCCSVFLVTALHTDGIGGTQRSANNDAYQTPDVILWERRDTGNRYDTARLCAGFFAIKAARRGPSITTLFYFTFTIYFFFFPFLCYMNDWKVETYNRHLWPLRNLLCETTLGSHLFH